MATVGFKTDFSSFTEHVILAWYKNDNILAEVDAVALPYPNVDGQVTTVPDLTTATYTFKFFFNTTGDVEDRDSLYKEWSVDVNDQTATFEILFYTVDGPETWDPVSGQDELIDSRLDGKTYYVSQRVNDWRQPSDYESITGGGFRLLTGEEFVANDQWTVMIANTISATPVSGGDYKDVKIVSADGTFDGTYKLKHNIANFATDTTGETTFDDFSIIADTRAKFSTYYTTARYWRLQFATGNTVKFLGADVNYIVLRQDCMIELFFKAGVCYVVDYAGKIEEAGEYLLADKLLRGTAYANGATGTIVDYQDLIDRLPAAKKCTYAQWEETVNVTIGDVTFARYKNRGKFAVDNVAGTFKFPDVRDFHFRSLKYTDGTTDSSMLSQGVGGAWAQDLLPHKHRVGSTGNQSGTDPLRAMQRSSTTPDPYNFGDAANKVIENTGGTRQMVDSIGQLALIRL